MALALALAAACRQDAPPDAGPAPATSAPADATAAALRALARDLRAEAVVAETNALNAPGADEVVDRLQRQLDGLRVYERIPLQPGADALVAALTAYSTQAGFTLADVQVTTHQSPRTLPTELVGPGKIAYAPEDLAATLTLELSLAPLDVGRLEGWLARLPRGVARMVEVRSVRGARDRFAVRVDAPWFLDTPVPRHRPAQRPLHDRLKAAGLPPAATLEQTHPAELAALRALQAQLDGYAPAIERGLGRLAWANLLEARYALFEATAKRIEAVTVATVLK